MLENTLTQMMQAYIAEESVMARRVAFAALFVVTMAASLWLAMLALAPGGFGIFDLATLVLFAATLSWIVAGFWNAVIGFIVMRFAADPAMAVMPSTARVQGDEPVTVSTAILLCVRNELPARVTRTLEPMLAGIVASGYGERFDLYVLSDTNDVDLANMEGTHFADLAQRWRDRVAITYRRRTVNTGYKAGNIREFCERWGNSHEFAVTLDADSFMTADAILRLVRTMQADSRLGILQGLVVGLPSTSLFARIFQFGMRLGMRSFSPKIATFIDLLLRPDARNAFGGGGRITVNFVIETVYSVLLCPILWISHTIFLAGLLFNREIRWIGQVRDDHAVPFRLALSSLWPQTIIGWVAIGLVSATQPAALPYVLFLAGGPALAVPFAMLTAWAPLGRLAARIGVGRLPEETATPAALLLLSLPAIRPAVQPGSV